jgi:hypothetical protein
MIFDIVSEPVDDTYRQLLARCREYSSTAILVLRDPDNLSSMASALLNRIQPWCISKEKRAEWPGTIMKNFLATVYTYRLDPALVIELQTVATGLYHWVQPELPEDLCLLRPDGTPILVTIAHERDAYLVVSQQEVDGLLSTIPGLTLHRRE